jgi:hypothetical protein
MGEHRLRRGQVYEEDGGAPSMTYRRTADNGGPWPTRNTGDRSECCHASTLCSPAQRSVLFNVMTDNAPFPRLSGDGRLSGLSYAP